MEESNPPTHTLLDTKGILEYGSHGLMYGGSYGSFKSSTEAEGLKSTTTPETETLSTAADESETTHELLDNVKARYDISMDLIDQVGDSMMMSLQLCNRALVTRDGSPSLLLRVSFLFRFFRKGKSTVNYVVTCYTSRSICSFSSYLPPQIRGSLQVSALLIWFVASRSAVSSLTSLCVTHLQKRP